MLLYQSVVYYGGEFMGEVVVYPQREEAENIILKEIRITDLSKQSVRVHPLAVLHTICRSGLFFKLDTTKSNSTQLCQLHASLITEKKTAVMALGGEELHLVAMYSRTKGKQHSCFWAFTVPPGLYAACLDMLNLRCLGIVFDLDETLVVANTRRSFEEKVEALQRKITTEVDPQRIAVMHEEIRRYHNDRLLLKQYAETDQIVQNSRVIRAQPEVIAALSDSRKSMFRPLIRLPEENMILTRINPQMPDTSVLVRLRPGWEELKSYLTAKGRKRFEVYVCTMAEREYALEIWRLLDPGAHLIRTEDLLSRIVCVTSGSKKSLLSAFQAGICHPNMALIIDDRLDVWDEKDQTRVHTVPPFAPYYAPQAEGSNGLPILCVARNVACNVRANFFGEFDNGLLPKIIEIAYEDDTKNIPSPPDACSYLPSEDDVAITTGTKDPSIFYGVTDTEIERKKKEAAAPSRSPIVTRMDPELAAPSKRTESSSSSLLVPAPQASIMPFPGGQPPKQVPLFTPTSHIRTPQASLESSAATEEGEITESELDPDTRRRLLILQHGKDTREQAVKEPPSRPPVPVSVPQTELHGSWFSSVEKMSQRPLNQPLNQTVARHFSLDSQPIPVEKLRPNYPLFQRMPENSIPSDKIIHENQTKPREMQYGDGCLRPNHSLSSIQPSSAEGLPLSRSISNNRELEFDPQRGSLRPEDPVSVLQEIAAKCGTKVEFKLGLLKSIELRFSVEVWMEGQKIGDGTGRTRKEAQYQASEISLKNLADIYVSSHRPDSIANDNESVCNFDSSDKQSALKGESTSLSRSSESSKYMDRRLEVSQTSMDSISALKEMCVKEGLEVVFQPSLDTDSAPEDELHAQAEVNGKVYGKGSGVTWDDAMMQAAERALGNLRSLLGHHIPHKHQGSSSSMHQSKYPNQESPQVR